MESNVSTFKLRAIDLMRQRLREQRSEKMLRGSGSHLKTAASVEMATASEI